jgi:hypothetical protein
MTHEGMEQEIRTMHLIHEYLDAKSSLQRILSSYNVHSVEEFKNKIESKSLPEHPSYEDYLEALSFEKDMAKLKTEINRSVEEVLK